MAQRSKVVDIRTWFGEGSSLDVISDWIDMGPRNDWEKDAACRDQDIAHLFFPNRGGTCRPAKAVCAGCPVRSDCLAAAIDNNERDGVWGGLNTEERVAVVRCLRMPKAS